MKAICLVLLSACLSAQGLRVFAIDVEGGKSTLFVSPTGQSMLVDTGYDGFGGRDAARIAAAAKAAGVKQIDYLVITHYHHDHVGGVPQLAAKLPILHFVDHGPNFETAKDNREVYDAYLAARKKGTHLEVKGGDTIPIPGLQVQVVTASGKAIASPLPGAGQPNPACADYHAIAADSGENAHSIGMLVTYGNFRLVDLGDLYWNQEFDLACPANKIGTVDVYMTTHHAKKTSGSPQMVWALHPKVAIMNNGPTTGGSAQAWQTIHDSPGFLDLWQLHRALGNDAAHNTTAAMTANLEEHCGGDYIELRAAADGHFSVVNGRTGFEKKY
ncbi:MAG TPA: MBL fold metallo-hydrolase [Candidatus Sulfopaludibacter sp.]|jgi:beta-lactamase superfamily II metal-dependent hydrolase|nr:MBL fold metallo-hydrolase [Candidatus Sulfopaludibacter sp.]